MFGIYIHWPFCESKCPYCDFNSHVWEQIDYDQWQRAYHHEIDRFAAELPSHEVTSIFFGGGTPSLMPPKLVADVIDRIAGVWRLAPDVEITAEANPGSAEAALFGAFRSAGVNRISIGVQSLDDAALLSLGRRHTAKEARSAVAAAADTMPRYSLDLIYARPGQTVRDWQRELDQALEIAGDHISAYQLTIEPGTEFHRQRIQAADDELGGELYDLTQTHLEAAGLSAYEISNHARPGAECRHNLLHWRGEDYVGIGPGAHGRLSNGQRTERLQEVRDPGAWLNAVAAKGMGTQIRAPLSATERRDELLLMGLRLSEGVSNEKFEAATGQSLEVAFGGGAWEDLTAGGFITFDGERLAATAAGRIRLNAVLARLLA